MSNVGWLQNNLMAKASFWIVSGFRLPLYNFEGIKLTMFEFGGPANLVGLSLLDIRTSLDSPSYLQGKFTI